MPDFEPWEGSGVDDPKVQKQTNLKDLGLVLYLSDRPGSDDHPIDIPALSTFRS